MLLLFVACSSSTSPQPSTAPKTEAPLSAQLPPPFTADQIRAAMPVGTRLLFKLDTPDGPRYQRWEVVASDDATGSFKFTDTDPEGEGVGGNVKPFRWEELEQHAHFPAGTKRARRTHSYAGKDLEGWRYIVPGDDHPNGFDFADALPGPPVRSPGMELIADSRL